MRIDPLLVILACLALGATACVAPAACVAAAALGSWALRTRLSRFQSCVAALAVCLGAARASWVLCDFGREQESAREWLGTPSRCAVVGQVASSPVLRAGKLRFDARLASIDCEGRVDTRPWRARLYVTEDRLNRGDEFFAVADLAPISLFRNLDLPDPRPMAAREGAVLSGAALSLEVTRSAWGLPALIDRARSHVRERILATFAGSVRGMARALVLGENDLSPSDDAAFRKSGLSHLLAVSGTHLIFAVLALVRGVESVLVRWQWLAARSDVRRYAASFGACLAPLYADFAGGSGSAWRAAWMLVAVLGVRALGRHVFPSRILAASLGVGWLSDALVVFDPSFALSMGATIGLLAMGQRLDEDLLTRAAELTEPRAPDLTKIARLISRAASTTLAATLPCVPILLLIAPGLSLASVGANLLAGPLGETLALPLCLAHALLSPFPLLERGVALVASGALSLIRGLAFASAGVEWLYFELPPPTPWHLACLVVGAASGMAARGRGWLGSSRSRMASGKARSTLFWVGACALGLASIEAFTVGRHSAALGRALGRLRVTALDVGQGDSTLIDLPDGRLMLIDGGGFIGTPIDPGERVILPTLRARRRKHIDVLVLTHPHPDHFGGLLAVAGSVSVGEFWYGGQAAPAPLPASSSKAAGAGGSYAELLDQLRRHGVSFRTAGELCGQSPYAHDSLHRDSLHHDASLNFASLGVASPSYRVEVLSPCPGVAPDQSANDNSLVVRIRLGAHAALFTGDAERWAEQRLLDSHPDDLRADFLKVGHHGSKSSSSPEFLEHVAPRYASLSSGVRNRFGHPHGETLRALAAAGARALRLDLEGAVRWQSDGTTQEVQSFAGAAPFSLAPAPKMMDLRLE